MTLLSSSFGVSPVLLPRANPRAGGYERALRQAGGPAERSAVHAAALRVAKLTKREREAMNLVPPKRAVARGIDLSQHEPLLSVSE